MIDQIMKREDIPTPITDSIQKFSGWRPDAVRELERDRAELIEALNIVLTAWEDGNERPPLRSPIWRTVTSARALLDSLYK
jgi:hypothetical protein